MVCRLLGRHIRRNDIKLWVCIISIWLCYIRIIIYPEGAIAQMADYSVSHFGGINNFIEQRDIEKGMWHDGQNFYVNLGVMQKREGVSKLHSDRLRGAIVGIFSKNMDKHYPEQYESSVLSTDGELIIGAGNYIYTGKYGGGITTTSSSTSTSTSTSSSTSSA